jgi:hypothetical protein
MASMALHGQSMYAGGSGDGYASGQFAQLLSTPGVFSGGIGDGWGRGGVAQPISTPGVFSGGTGDGWARDGMAQPISTVGVFSGGIGDGWGRGGVAQSISTAGVFGGGNGDGWALGGFAQPISTAGIFSGGIGDGYARNSGASLRASVQTIAFLEGPYSTGTSQMNGSLRTAGLIPLTEPYTASGYPQAGGGGGETTTPAMLTNVSAVDWVRAELRDASNPAVLVAVRHALVQPDGYLIDPVTGDDFIQFNVLPGSYYVVVRHRNHLGAMTAAPIALSASAAEVDFTLPSTATFGTAAQKTIGSRTVLWSGDVTGNHQVKYTGSGNDRDPILVKVGSTTPNNIVTGQYLREDVNMDAVVKYTGSANDRDPILVNVGSTTPNNTRVEQVP